jgi:hypothetical protein
MNRWLTALLAVLSVALIALVVVWLLREDEGVSLTVGEPETATAAQLEEFAEGVDHPIYWLGERDGREYELTETASGRVYVRYLEQGAEAGDPRSDFVTVGTYPSRRAVAQLGQAARNRDGAKLGKTDDGAVLLVDPASPNNAHLAYPDTDFQIEVFSSVPGQALRLSSRGAVQPVG